MKGLAEVNPFLVAWRGVENALRLLLSIPVPGIGIHTTTSYELVTLFSYEFMYFRIINDVYL